MSSPQSPRPIDDALWPTLRLLGYGGWLPFAGALALSWFTPAQALAHQALLAYAVAIVSFVGALSWGWALALPDLNTRQRQGLLLWSVVPSLLAWLAACLPAPWVWWALVLTYALAWLMDWRHQTLLHWPAAWMALRSALTAGATLALMAAALTGV